ncbi:MAG: hypothetical protein MUC80_00500 [Candidatus Thermoplasmatota archaeon]|jgi:hypothetical protein|nr:hypothetical protein [Candidatus Thermoplasmatota archaeon]
MVESIIKVATGSTANRIDAHNIKNGLTQSNIYFLGIDGWTPQHKEYQNIGDRRVTSLTLGTYGLGGMVFSTKRLANTLKPRIEELLLRIEEISNENGDTNKILYTTLFGTGTSGSTTPIVAEASRARGLTSLIFSVIPSDLSEGYQRLNSIYSLTISNASVILVNEDFAESTSLETRNRAESAVGMNPSKYHVCGQYSMEFCNRLARIISGTPEYDCDKGTKEGEDDLGFLDVTESNHRNMSVELESAIGKRPEFYCLHYSHSQKINFEELAILRPSVMPSSNPGNPLIFVQYDASQTSEEEVSSSVIMSLEAQGLKPERMFIMPSKTNEVVALIPSGVPPRLRKLLRLLAKEKPLKEVMENMAKRTILSSIPPIRIGSERRILQDQMTKIFYDDKSELETLAKTLGLGQDLVELKERNLLFHLAEEHGVYLKPLEVS